MKAGLTAVQLDKYWQSNEIFGVLQNYSVGNSLVILYAGNRNFFISGAKCMYKLGSSSDDYHVQMKYENLKNGLKISCCQIFCPNR